ncbi:uncharacterized protein [Cicer arietinum]|uniref:Uncharacterized protein LOC105851834 n=1 Tax=Cicer arietinum TaxID=3827 RepID=A0A1S3E1D4_CICAR|nr:uncharacterized protein LOC105851834 [Cicer arietinum]
MWDFNYIITSIIIAPSSPSSSSPPNVGVMLVPLFMSNCATHVDSFSKPLSGSDEPQQGGWLRNFAVAAYKPYFDVDTSDVLERIIDSLFPFRGTFNEKTSTNPDL